MTELRVEASSKEYIQNIFHKVATSLDIALHEHPSLQDEFEHTVLAIYRKTKKGTYYRNIRKITPYILYMFLRVKQLVFRKRDYIDVVGIERLEFNRHLKRVMRLYPEYQNRDKIQTIINKLRDLADHYGLKVPYLRRCELIFKHYYPSVAYSTAATAATFIGGLAFLTFEGDSLTLTDICTHLGVEASTFYNTVVRYLLSEEEKSQFTGVFRNRTLILNKIATRTGLKPEELHNPLPISAKSHSVSDVNSNDLDARMDHLAKKAGKMRKETNINEVPNPEPLICRYTTPSHEKRGYPLTQQDKKDIIKLHLKDRPLEKISFDLNIKTHIVKSVIEAFSEGTIHIANSAASQTPAKITRNSGLHLVKENPFPRHGELRHIEKLQVRCQKCGNPLLKLGYKDGKVVFFCKYCYY